MTVNVGRSIKVALAQREKTVQWLAEQLECSRTHASNLANTPSASSRTIDRLAMVFNLSAANFIALGEDVETSDRRKG